MQRTRVPGLPVQTLIEHESAAICFITLSLTTAGNRLFVEEGLPLFWRMRSNDPWNVDTKTMWVAQPGSGARLHHLHLWEYPLLAAVDVKRKKRFNPLELVIGSRDRLIEGTAEWNQVEVESEAQKWAERRASELAKQGAGALHSCDGAD